MGFNITASSGYCPLSESPQIQDTTTLATGLFTRVAYHLYQQRQQESKKRRPTSTLKDHEKIVSQLKNQQPDKCLEYILKKIQHNQEITLLPDHFNEFFHHFKRITSLNTIADARVHQLIQVAR